MEKFIFMKDTQLNFIMFFISITKLQAYYIAENVTVTGLEGQRHDIFSSLLLFGLTHIVWKTICF